LLGRYVLDEDEWIASGRVLLCPGVADLREWMDANRDVLAPSEYVRVGGMREQTLYSKQVIREDGMVHDIEQLVPGCGKYLLHHYYWGDAGGGVERWLY
jgi:hypothetical protein